MAGPASRQCYLFFQHAAHGGIACSANSTDPLAHSSRSIWEGLTHKSSEMGGGCFSLVLHLIDLPPSPFSSSTSNAFQSLPSSERHILVQWDLSKMFLVLPPLHSHSHGWPPVSGSCWPSAYCLAAFTSTNQANSFCLQEDQKEPGLGLCFYVWAFLIYWVSEKK